MDVHSVFSLLLLLLLTCAITTSLSENRPLERNRRYTLSTFLVPPPPPVSQRLPHQLPARTGRNANRNVNESPPGYFTRFMSWLNPFSLHDSSLTPPPPQPPPPSVPRTPPHAAIYEASQGPLLYDRPPPPLPPLQSLPQPLPQPPPPSHVHKGKNCNPCNRFPWVPMGSSGAGYLPPDNRPPNVASANVEYLPVENHHHHQHRPNAAPIAAPSQHVKLPDFFYAPPVPEVPHGQLPHIGPLPNPHLYPGPMPPLFKAEPFDLPSRSNHPPPSAVEPLSPIETPGNLAHGNFATANQGQLIYESHQLSNVATGVDSLPSASQENRQGTANSLSAQQSYNGDNNGDRRPSGPSALDNFGRDTFIRNRDEQNLPTNEASSNFYGASKTENFGSLNVFDQQTGNTDVSSDLQVPVYFEESPLTDLTKLSESRTDSPSISSPSSTTTYLDVGQSQDSKSTLFYDTDSSPLLSQRGAEVNGERIFEKGASLDYSTESTVEQRSTLESKIDEEKSAADSFEATTNATNVQAADTWSAILSTTVRTSQEESSWKALKKPYVHLERNRASSSSDSNDNVRSNGAKRNKQVQVIIPYTSQYTPIPFHGAQEGSNGNGNVERNEARKVSLYPEHSNYDSYVSEESRSQVKVIDPPQLSTLVDVNSSNVQSVIASSTESTTETATRSSLTRKSNNSIDVHRLQKNIDNWTIQEYSRGTTASTASPSSLRPYLQPSKKIPQEYLTSTESNKSDEKGEDHVKSFALAGFSFNEVEDESSNNRFEESRIEAVRVENPKEKERSNSTNIRDEDANATTESQETTTSWKEFSLSSSPSDMEKVYVVTPQTTTTATRQSSEEKSKATGKNSKKASVVYSKSSKNKRNELETIERAYQVLPQAVNNLAVASTGPENLPLWGIMEHEEFASLPRDEHSDEDDFLAPVLYAGHSKVSRARR